MAGEVGTVGMAGSDGREHLLDDDGMADAIQPSSRFDRYTDDVDFRPSTIRKRHFALVPDIRCAYSAASVVVGAVLPCGAYFSADR